MKKVVGVLASLVLFTTCTHIFDFDKEVYSKAWSDPSLKVLSISTGTLDPAFNPEQTEYKVSVAYPVTSLSLVAEATQKNARASLSDETLKTLSVGENICTVSVTAPDLRTIRTYTLRVVRAAPSLDAGLASLEPSVGSLSPAFSTTTMSYTVAVPYATTELNITGIVSDATASMNPADGVAVVSDLEVNVPKTASIAVTAQDGTTGSTYTVSVTRLPSNNAQLLSLELSDGFTLSPAFAPDVFDYALTVLYDIDSITLTGLLADETAIMEGDNGRLVDLVVGENVLTIDVLAQDGFTGNSYSVLVTRLPSVNANLLSLELSDGFALSPAFAPGVFDYSLVVPYATTSLTVTGTKADATAIMNPVDGVAVVAGLEVNVPKTASIAVTAQDGVTSNTYRVNIERQSNVATLSALTTSVGSLSPAFSPTTLSYTVIVPNSVTHLTVSGTRADASATMSPADGVLEFTNLPLGFSGEKSFTLSSQDGSVSTSYKIKVYRQSSDAGLVSLSLSDPFSLEPSFAPGILDYTISVPYATTSLTVTGTKADTNATMDPVDGKLSFTGLSVGTSSEKTITVTSQDGSVTKEYKVKVLRQSNDATLSGLTTSTGTLSPVFNAATTSYTVTVPYSVTSLTVTGTKANTNATMTPSNGLLSFTGLSVGTSSEKTIKVTSEDGSVTKEYKVKVLRQSNDATLSALTTNQGSLSPVFNAATTSYTVTVPYSVTSLTVTGTKANTNATMTPSNGLLSFTGLSVGTSSEKTIKVVSQDGSTTKDYKVKVLRQSNVATVSGLTTSTGTLSPVFNAATTSYTVTVPYATTSLTVTGTAVDNATMDPSNGVLSFTGLSVGTSSEKTIKVTSQDGNVTNEYKVKVVRQHAEIEMLLVPAGRFQRDGTATNISVITKPYSLSKYQITRQQFKDIMGTDPSNKSYSSGMDDPVQYVNWYHAIAFCNKLSLLEDLTPAYTVSVVSDWANLAFSSIPTSSNTDWDGATCDFNASGYRLPTEMEWMWAAMGAPADGQNGGVNTNGRSKAYAGQGYGAGTSIDDYAWYTSNSSSKTHPVGEKLPNELGLYDMSGNVREMCWDWYGTYPTGTITDYLGSPSDTLRVNRGGSWNTTTYCTVAYRGSYDPYYRNYGRGFRLLRPIL